MIGIADPDLLNASISIAAISSAILVFFLEQRREIERRSTDIANGVNVIIIFPPQFRLIIRRMFGLLPQLTLNSHRDARISAYIDLSAIIIFFSLLTAVVIMVFPNEDYVELKEGLFLTLIALLGSLIGGIMVWAYWRGESIV